MTPSLRVLVPDVSKSAGNYQSHSDMSLICSSSGVHTCFHLANEPLIISTEDTVTFPPGVSKEFPSRERAPHHSDPRFVAQQYARMGKVSISKREYCVHLPYPERIR